MKIYHFTYAVLGLVIATGTASVATVKVKNKVSKTAVQQSDTVAKWRKKDDERKKQFPIADFDEPEPTDPKKRAVLKEKKIRYNKLGLVTKHPTANDGGGEFHPEGMFNFPALPVDASDVIVFGEVLDAQAHLSEDKSNVFSEFTIQVERAYKNATGLGSEITVERIGGFVRYPDGKKLHYGLTGTGMPQVGAKYILFLKAIPKENSYTILTGYQLGVNGVSPLDSAPIFETYRGYKDAEFFAALEGSLSKTSNP
jgi:hypothetical protein